MTFVLDHLGKPRVAATLDAAWARDIRDLAALPNIYCKLSGLATEAVDPGDRHLMAFLRFALETFGPDRCLFGSDWPVLTSVMGYGRWRAVVLEAIADLTAAEQRQVMAETAITVYRIAARSSSPARGRRRRPRGVVGWKHCRPLARTLTAQRMFDWLDDQIGSSTSQG